MRKPKRFFLSLIILALTLGLSVMPLPVQARDAVRSVNPTQFDPLYAATSKYGFMSPGINETAKEAEARHDIVPEEDRYPVAMVDTYHRVSSPILLDLLHSILGQHYVTQFTAENLSGVNLSEVNEPLARAGTERLAAGIDSGNNSIPVEPKTQSSGPGSPGTPDTDRAVLVALYQATDGENWAMSTNWLSDRPLGEWYGIVTNDSGRVTEIGLPQNLLAGELPSEVSDLTELTRLDLRRNELIGEMPDDLDDLINLDSLSLANNLLSGEIPAELGNLPNLESLSLENNYLDGDIPTGLGNLSALESLSLGNNQFSGIIPLEIGNLINLRWLSIGGNQMSGEIPDELGNLANLTYLNLRYNRLSGQIPAELSGLTRLTHLDLSRNRLNGQIPTGMGDLTDLELLSLRGNQLSGQIPSELGSLTSLIQLDLSDNQLVGQIPSELSSLSKLIGLYLSGNRFTGCIPVELWVVSTSDLDELGLPDCGGLAVVMSIPAGGVQVRIATPIVVTATFSEPVTGFTVGDVSVVNGSAGSFSGSDGDTVYTFAVVPNAIGAVTVDIAAGVAEDSGGNGNRAARRLRLGMPYDDDGNGTIEKNEVINAINDYLFAEGDEAISKGDVIKLINLYLFG